MSSSTGSGKQVIPKQSFLGVPGEIRDMVYEDLLLGARVRTQTINPKFDDRPFRSLPDVDRTTPGNVQGLSPWTIEYRLETAILSVKEVQKDAHAIFEKNNWVHITVNVGDYSAQLRETGFEVLTSARAQDIKNPSLEIKISFDVTTRGEDKFFWPSGELSALSHALSLTSGYDEAKLQLTICARPGDEAKSTTVTHQEAREWELIGPLIETVVKPRSVEIIGSRSAKIAKWLQDYDGIIQKSDEVMMKMIDDKLDESNKALQAECWQEAYDKAVSCQGLVDIAFKCDVERRRYHDLAPYFASTCSQCLSNITLARLRLGDAKGALKKSRQIIEAVLPSNCCFDARLRQAMAYTASNDFSTAIRFFKAAQKLSPSHPQLIEELKALKGHLIRETALNQEFKADTAVNVGILQYVTEYLGSQGS